MYCSMVSPRNEEELVEGGRITKEGPEGLVVRTSWLWGVGFSRKCADEHQLILSYKKLCHHNYYTKTSYMLDASVGLSFTYYPEVGG